MVVIWEYPKPIVLYIIVVVVVVCCRRRRRSRSRHSHHHRRRCRPHIYKTYIHVIHINQTCDAVDGTYSRTINNMDTCRQFRFGCCCCFVCAPFGPFDKNEGASNEDKRTHTHNGMV